MSTAKTANPTPLGLYPGQAQPGYFDRVIEELRTRHCSRRTEEAYVGWVARLIEFQHRRNPADMGRTQIKAFLSHLTVARNVAVSTQNEALSSVAAGRIRLPPSAEKTPDPFSRGFSRGESSGPKLFGKAVRFFPVK